MPTYEYTKQVTKTLLKCVIDEPVHVKIVAKMYLGEDVKAAAGETKKMEKPTMIDVIDLDNPLPSGLPKVMICNAVVKSSLETEYPGQSYVGKCFEIIKGKAGAGKQYNPFTITEIKVKA